MHLSLSKILFIFMSLIALAKEHKIRFTPQYIVVQDADQAMSNAAKEVFANSQLIMFYYHLIANVSICC